MVFYAQSTITVISERERGNSNSNSTTLFYKDCSLGTVKNLSKLILAKLLSFTSSQPSRLYQRERERERI